MAGDVDRLSDRHAALLTSEDARIVLLAVIGIVAHAGLRYAAYPIFWNRLPLLLVLAAGGLPLVIRLVWQGLHGQFGADHVAAISIVASALLGEYLAGTIVVLMLSGGNTLEQFAVAEATSVLRALARRVPTLAHRRRGGVFEDVAVADIRAGDEISLLPHEICPVDGEVVQGHGTVDESYLTGEPFTISKGRARRFSPAPSTARHRWRFGQPGSRPIRVSRRSCA